MNDDPNAPVILTTSPLEAVAATIAAALRERGIPAEVAGGALTGMRAETVVSAQVLVRRSDLQLAKDALRALKSESVDIDWNEVDLSASPSPEPRSADDAWPAVLRWLLAAYVGGVILLLSYDLLLMRTGIQGYHAVLLATMLIAGVALVSLVVRANKADRY
ncbi:MAG: hypothetical protein ACREJO_16460 [Phycisphaerales bacterium]